MLEPLLPPVSLVVLLVLVLVLVSLDDVLPESLVDEVSDEPVKNLLTPPKEKSTMRGLIATGGPCAPSPARREFAHLR
jgi:hypothetical protein